MKQIFLSLAVFSILFFIYFMYERSDIFLEIFKGRPYSQIPFSDLLKPLVLGVMSLLFLNIYRKTPSKTVNHEK